MGLLYIIETAPIPLGGDNFKIQLPLEGCLKPLYLSQYVDVRGNCSFGLDMFISRWQPEYKINIAYSLKWL